MNDPLLPILCAVKSRQVHSDDVFTLEIEAPAHYPAFGAGQFNMLYMPGAGEAAISISGDPASSGSLIHTIRAVGNVTDLLGKCRNGDRIGIRGPFGKSWPLAAAKGKDLVLVAGGIGMAPLRPVLYQALAERDCYNRIVLFYGARTPADILYADEFMAWKQRGLLDLFVSVDTAAGDWAGDVGVITGLIPRAKVEAVNSVAMICGPEIMIRFSVNKLRELGLSRKQIHISLERNMKCAVGFCGHCQLGPHFICKDGPVFSYDQVESLLMAQGF